MVVHCQKLNYSPNRPEAGPHREPAAASRPSLGRPLVGANRSNDLFAEGGGQRASHSAGSPGLDPLAAASPSGEAE